MNFGTTMAKVRDERENHLDPSNYQFCCEYYVGPNDDIRDAFGYEHWPEDCLFTEKDLGDCGHCGTDHYYGAIFRDVRTGEYLAIGNVCASKFFHFDSKKAYYVAQAKQAALSRAKAEKAKREAEEFLFSRPALVEAFKIDHYIIKDIERKLWKYGSISERQVELVLKIAHEELNKEPEPEKKPIPDELLDGRHRFTGTVLGFKEVENHYSYRESYITKMVFRDDRGFTLYGTAISADEGYNKGDRVAFDATCQRSDRDATFGFFKRPTKYKVLENSSPDSLTSNE